MLILGIALFVAPILIAGFLSRRLRTRTASVTR
jgi:hypothetical protein